MAPPTRPDRVLQTPPPARSFHAARETPFSTLRRRGRGSPSLTVNDRKVLDGAQTAETLMMLGFVEDEFTAAWEAFVTDRWPTISWGSSPPVTDEYAVTHQDGAGWTFEAWVEGIGRKIEVPELAYVDLNQVRRRLTFRMREWNHLIVTDAQIRDPNWRFDATVGRTSTLRTQTLDLAPGSAVGSWYSGLDDGEIDATYTAARALEACRRDLQKAVDEIEVAIKVADAAWQGPRADVAKYKFCLESMMNEAIGAVAHQWEDFTQDVVRIQRQAKSHDDQLQREVAAEVLIQVVVGVLSFGTATLARGSAFFAKLVRWSAEFSALLGKLRGFHGRALAAVLRTLTGVKAIRVAARTAGDMATRGAVDAAGGPQVTGETWLISFLFAGMVGQKTSDWATALLAKESVAKRFGVTFMSPARYGAWKGAIQGGTRAGARGGSTTTGAAAFEISLGQVMTGFVVGVPGEAAKQTVKARLLRQLEAMRPDIEARVVAEAAAGSRGAAARVAVETGDRAAIKKLVDEEMARLQAGLDPQLDFFFTASSSGAVHGARTATGTGPGGEPRPPGGAAAPAGMVASPVRPPAMPAGADLAEDQRRAPSRVVPFTYHVARGDTLSDLAGRYLGDRDRWPEIAAANPGVDPDEIDPGQALVVPAP